MNHFEIIKDLLAFTNTDDSISMRDIVRIAHEKCIEYSSTTCPKPCFMKRDQCIYNPGDITRLPSDILESISNKSKVETCRPMWIKLRVDKADNIAFEVKTNSTAIENKILIEVYLPWNLNLKLQLRDFLKLDVNCTNILEKKNQVNFRRVLSHRCHGALWQRLRIPYVYADEALRLTLFTFDMGDNYPGNWNLDNSKQILPRVLRQLHEMLNKWASENAIEVRNIDSEVGKSIEYQEFSMLNYLNVCTFTQSIPSKLFKNIS